MTNRSPSIHDQELLLDRLLDRLKNSDGTTSARACLYLEPDDVRDLVMLRDRLRRMAPFERKIRQMVTGGRG